MFVVPTRRDQLDAVYNQGEVVGGGQGGQQRRNSGYLSTAPARADGVGRGALPRSRSLPSCSAIPDKQIWADSGETKEREIFAPPLLPVSAVVSARGCAPTRLPQGLSEHKRPPTARTAQTTTRLWVSPSVSDSMRRPRAFYAAVNIRHSPTDAHSSNLSPS
jgi:hypothetical protein